MAEGGCSGRRFRRHFADLQGHILNGRFGASSSESRPSPVGHLLSSVTVSIQLTLRCTARHPPERQFARDKLELPHTRWACEFLALQSRVHVIANCSGFWCSHRG